MTDDISKVVKFLLGEGELRGAWFGDEPPGALGPMPRFWWRKDLRAAFARLESATAPAEVEVVAAYLEDEAGWSNDLTGQKLQDAAATIRTLARQLAEAKAENAIATSVHEHERLNLMSQLADATRRVAEVERIKRDIEELYDVMPMLPITAETMEAATDWLTRYCIDFYREINAAQVRRQEEGHD